MRFLIDEQLPPALAWWLASKGHEADHIFDFDLSGASDQQIWEMALRLGAVVVTKDEDFGRLRMTRGAGPRIVWLRLPNTRTGDLIRWFEAILPAIIRSLEGGEIVIDVE